MLTDVKFAFRQLIKARGFSTAAILVLALAIGANTAVFSLVYTMFFAPPAYANPAELVQVFSKDTKDPKTYRGFSYPTYRDIREQNTVFRDVMAYNLALVGIGQAGDTRRAFAALVSSNYFSVLGVPLDHGRAFLPEEETPGRPSRAAIVSYSYWQRHDRPALGSTLTINGRSFAIVGVTQPSFTGAVQIFCPDVWLPFSVYDEVDNDFQSSEQRTAFGDRAGRQLVVIGRLKPGLTIAAAEPSLKGLAANLEKAYPIEQKNQTFEARRLTRWSDDTSPSEEGEVTQIAPLLLGMAMVVLLVACLNLATMLLARGTARRKEMAIRLALGGRRIQIVRQLLMEGLVLALSGGFFGLLLGLWSSDLLIASFRRLMPLDMVWNTGPNPSILMATFGFCLVGTLAFALGPALKLSRHSVLGDLKQQAGEDAVRRWKFLPRHPLVVVQISFSLVLLVAAALFVRAANKAASVETGLDPGASLLVETDASLAGYDAKRTQELYRNLSDRLAALPGVEKVSISATVPFGMISLSKDVQRAGIHPAAGQKPATAEEGLAFHARWNGVGSDYFSTVGLPILRGRAFTLTEATQSDGPIVAIIDDVLAKKLWGNGDALGRRVQFATGNDAAAKHAETKPNESIEIVGVVPATRHSLFQKNPPGAIYLPFARSFQSDVTFFVRFRSLAGGTEVATSNLLRRTVHDLDPSLPILSLKTFRQHLEANVQLWIVRAGATLFSMFGLLALALSIVGLYGVKAYSVARRTREIGIRMALGAQRAAVMRMIMQEGSVMLICGVSLGLLLAAGAGKVLSGILYHVGALDPVAFGGAALLLVIASLIATWFPARRATRINPIQALRTE